MLEIYNETIRDLLSPNRSVSQDMSRADNSVLGKQYAIKHDANGNTHVSDLTVVDVCSIREVSSLLQQAAQSRLESFPTLVNIFHVEICKVTFQKKGQKLKCITLGSCYHVYIKMNGWLFLLNISFCTFSHVLKHSTYKFPFLKKKIHFTFKFMRAISLYFALTLDWTFIYNSKLQEMKSQGSKLQYRGCISKSDHDALHANYQLHHLFQHDFLSPKILKKKDCFNC